MMDVCLLGNGGMMPLPHRPLSATVVRVGGETVLFDCGENTQVNWRISDFGFRQTGTILLSHVHADHVAGLPGILFQISFSGRTEPVTIYGPEWTPEVVKNLTSIVGRLPYELRVCQLDGGETFTIGDDMLVSTMLLTHRIPCIGYRIEVPRAPRFNPERARELGIPLEHWKTLQRGQPAGGFDPAEVSGPPRRGLRLTLMTDTAYSESLATFAAGSDLLVCEAMFGPDEDRQRALERGHMTFTQAATIARDAAVHELWLTHFSPKIDNPESYLPAAQQVFPNTISGVPGLSTTLAFSDE